MHSVNPENRRPTHFNLLPSRSFGWCRRCRGHRSAPGFGLAHGLEETLAETRIPTGLFAPFAGADRPFVFLAGLLDVRSVLIHRPLSIPEVDLGLLAAVGVVLVLGTRRRITPGLTVLGLLVLAVLLALRLRLRLLVLTGPSPATRSRGGTVA